MLSTISNLVPARRAFSRAAATVSGISAYSGGAASTTSSPKRGINMINACGTLSGLA